MDADKVKIMGSKVKVDSIMKVAEIEEAEKLKMKRKVEKILKYKPDVFINRQLILAISAKKVICYAIHSLWIVVFEFSKERALRLILLFD